MKVKGGRGKERKRWERDQAPQRWAINDLGAEFRDAEILSAQLSFSFFNALLLTSALSLFLFHSASLRTVPLFPPRLSAAAARVYAQRWVLSRAHYTRAHASMPASARLATRQRQHHQYFSLLTVLVQYVQQACPCNSARNGPSQVTITRQMANFPATLYTNEPLIRLFSLFLLPNRTTISIYIGKIYKMKRIFERNEKTTDTLFYHYFISFGEG